MLPATQSPQTPQWCLINDQIGSIALSKNRPLDMCRFEFAPRTDNFTGIRNQYLRDILAAAMLFRISERHVNIVRLCSLLDAFHFWAISADGILRVFRNEL